MDTDERIADFQLPIVDLQASDAALKSAITHVATASLQEEEVEPMKPEGSIEQEVERTNSTYANDFLSNLAERLGATAKASVVYAEPVERDGVTVIPVAKARWGFGGGAGRKKDEDGVGGGGGVQVTPIGFIELRNGEARFRRIHTISLPVGVVGAVTGLVLLGSFFRRR